MRELHLCLCCMLCIICPYQAQTVLPDPSHTWMARCSLVFRNIDVQLQLTSALLVGQVGLLTSLPTPAFCMYLLPTPPPPCHSYPDGSRSKTAPNMELQKQRALCAAASGMAWGSPHMMWWQFQDNEKDKQGRYRGFWLVDANNKPTPLWLSMQQYFKDANDYVRSVVAATGSPPTSYAFRRWGVKRLIELSGRSDNCQWRPYVRPW